MTQTPALGFTDQAVDPIRVPGRREAPQTRLARLVGVAGALVSFEMSFLLFIFAGDFKNMPELGWFSIDFTLFFVTVSFGMAIILILKQHQWTCGLSDTAIILYVLFLSWTLWSLTWSSFDEFNITKAVKTCILVTWCFIGGYLIVAEERLRVTRFVIILMAVSATLLAYWGYYHFILGVVDQNTGATEAGNYLNYGFHARYLIAILTAFLVASQSFGRSLLCAAAVVAVFVLMLVIGARGPLLWALFTVPLALVFLLVNRHARGYRTRFLTVLLSFVFIFGVMALSLMWAGPERVESLSPEMRTVERFETFYAPDFGESAGGRIRAQLFAFESWLEAPLIGWGLGEFEQLYPGGPEGLARRFVYPHNLFLEVLMEEGIVGFALLGALTGLGLVRAWKLWPAGGPEWPVIALILLFIPHLMSRAVDQGFLSDERALFAFLGLILGLGHRAVNRAGAA